LSLLLLLLLVAGVWNLSTTTPARNPPLPFLDDLLVVRGASVDIRIERFGIWGLVGWCPADVVMIVVSINVPPDAARFECHSKSRYGKLEV
jgi:hypothetical protein